MTRPEQLVVAFSGLLFLKIQVYLPGRQGFDRECTHLDKKHDQEFPIS